MDHIPTYRLMDLSQEAIILDPDEIQHLRECDECDAVLRIFARQFRVSRMMDDEFRQKTRIRPAS